MSIADDIVDGEICPLCCCPPEICGCSAADIKNSGGHMFLAGRKNHRVVDQSDQYERILATGATVSVKNNGLHWIIQKDKLRFDYWPTKGKYQLYPTRAIQFGFQDMLKCLEDKNQ